MVAVAVVVEVAAVVVVEDHFLSCLRSVRHQFIRASAAKVHFDLLIANNSVRRQTFTLIANIINSAKVVINSTNSSLGHWRQDVSWIGNNLSLGGRASFEIMIRWSDPVIE